jgi:predicted DNA-binding transcriptional regulator AlpA
MAAPTCAVRMMSEKPESVVRHLTQVQVADRWQMSVRTLERWRWRGQGPRFMKLGGRVAYRLEDIEAFELEQLREITPRGRKPRSRKA